MSFRCFLRDPTLPDEHAVEQAVTALRAVLAIEGTPERVHVVRLPAALPRYSVGHAASIARIEALAARVPGLSLAGNAYAGLGPIASARAVSRAAELGQRPARMWRSGSRRRCSCPRGQVSRHTLALVRSLRTIRSWTGAPMRQLPRSRRRRATSAIGDRDA